MKTALIGFGEVGQVLGQDLNTHQVSAYDTLFDQSDSKPTRAVLTARCERSASAQAAVADAQVVISAVTVDQAVAAARSVYPFLQPGTWFVDLNSASPEVRRTQAEMIEARAGRYVEVAVMSPISPQRLASPLLLGGAHAAAFKSVARELGFSAARVYSQQLGQASAAKLCRSVVIKGFESLLTESLVAARHFGVEETVLDSLKGFPGTQDWTDIATYQLTRTVQHGRRRSAEMMEAAATVAQSGLEPTMSEACADKQAWASTYPAALGVSSLPDMLDQLLREPATKRNQPC